MRYKSIVHHEFKKSRLLNVTRCLHEFSNLLSLTMYSIVVSNFEWRSCYCGNQKLMQKSLSNTITERFLKLLLPIIVKAIAYTSVHLCRKEEKNTRQWINMDNR